VATCPGRLLLNRQASDHLERQQLVRHVPFLRRHNIGIRLTCWKLPLSMEKGL
jgi:hypothetical protein